MDESRRCSARSTQSGKRCKKAAIMGGTVCASHGGSAPQVKQAARERLQALVDPAIGALKKALDEGDYGNIIKAALGVLDRTGYGPKSTTEVTGQGGGPISLEHSTVPTVLFCKACLKRAQEHLKKLASETETGRKYE